MFLSIFVTGDYYPQRFETKQTRRLIDLALTQLATNHGTIALALNACEWIFGHRENVAFEEIWTDYSANSRHRACNHNVKPVLLSLFVHTRCVRAS